eukprot:CAMPEP_0203958698 /NCGR_PEP_ID=MMETSP0359-20131031/90041_1 /ASSEMBLY_ACC=CAM_ASM_000338 /TAXON_ID=268821 /ORGANISM="Scrippsiella Hangoei, Strain SHTV-5" /LENGTH=229 /DNA_ID=CAMNT_0050892679 /DNA_START=63 /DNA_END=749 /DNA_ORIENTATION=-
MTSIFSCCVSRKTEEDTADKAVVAPSKAEDKPATTSTQGVMAPKAAPVAKADLLPAAATTTTAAAAGAAAAAAALTAASGSPASPSAGKAQNTDGPADAKQEGGGGKGNRRTRGGSGKGGGNDKGKSDGGGGGARRNRGSGGGGGGGGGGVPDPAEGVSWDGRLPVLETLPPLENASGPFSVCVCDGSASFDPMFLRFQRLSPAGFASAHPHETRGRAHPRPVAARRIG